ncbi:MAG: serine/threonine-protein kinase [Nocardioides sp.]|nr:serine/threonine-protein kinase [Nocardioides sp.]
MVPERIAGRYDVVREVGRGGMGAVYLCEDRTLGREVAIKQVGGLPGESTSHLARALREARSSAALNHPHVVAIYDTIEEGGHVWLVMEYLPSRTLRQLANDGPLEPSRAAAIGAQVAEGLAAAHARGTIHRDVKPGNILVTDDDTAKISDFGIARTDGDDQLTQTGLVSGTPLYFSPALARGAEPSAADDVWALGASLFAAVEGRTPWPAKDNPVAMLVHIADNPPPVPERAGPLTSTIRRMMDADPAARPSMAEAARALRAVADGRSGDEPTAVFGAAGAGAAGDEGAETTTTATPAPMAPAPAAGSSEGRGRRRRAAALVIAAGVLGVALAAALLSGLLGGEGEDTVSERPDQTSSPAAEPSPDPPEEEPDAEPVQEPEPEAEPAGAAQVVQDYYALLPGDTRSAWNVLGEPMRQTVGSYGRYRGFWSTIDAVTVNGTDESDEGTVRVDLTYASNGGTQSETREITVRDGLIVADSVV